MSFNTQSKLTEASLNYRAEPKIKIKEKISEKNQGKQ